MMILFKQTQKKKKKREKERLFSERLLLKNFQTSHTPLIDYASGMLYKISSDFFVF